MSESVLFNIVIRWHSSYVETLRQNSEKKKTLLAVYTALLIHVETCKGDLIDKFHRFGLCIAHDHVL